MLYVREINVFRDYDRDEIVVAICFSNYPYVVLTDETRRRIFNNYDEAVKALNEFNSIVEK